MAIRIEHFASARNHSPNQTRGTGRHWAPTPVAHTPSPRAEIQYRLSKAAWALWRRFSW